VLFPIRKTIQVAIALALLSSSLSAQNPVDRHRILFLLNNVAEAYLLNATRPYIEIETDLPTKNKYVIDLYPSGGDGYADLPAYAQFGLTDRLSLVGSVHFYNTAYSLTGTKSTGLGDSYVGVSYNVQKSDLMQNYLQMSVKIPTADQTVPNLGTGKFDYDIGVGQSLTYKKFSYDLSGDVDFMKRADFPPINLNTLPKPVVDGINILRKNFQYEYEQQLTLVMEPTYEFTDALKIEGGIAGISNLKLNFSTGFYYGDLNYSFTSKLDAYVGGSQSSFQHVHFRETSVLAGIDYTFSDQFSINVEASVGVGNFTGHSYIADVTISN